MAEKDLTPVAILLDRSRPYPRNDDRDVVWVGPGVVAVPRWVAEHWGNKIIEPAEELPAKVTDDAEIARHLSASVDEVESPISPTAQTGAHLLASLGIPDPMEANTDGAADGAGDGVADDLGGLGLLTEQITSLAAAGIRNRTDLRAALEENGDKGMAGLPRTVVRALRKALEEDGT